MATLDQIQADVNSAKVYSIQQMALQITLMKNGSRPKEICDLTALKRMIRCLSFQINAGVVDADTNRLYNCLLAQLGGFNHAYAIDPEVVIPGTNPIIVVPYQPLLLTKTQADLVLDVVAEQYYLPYLDNSDNPITNGQIPAIVLLNGETMTFNFAVQAPDLSYYPTPRIYSFANNAPQSIIVKCI